MAISLFSTIKAKALECVSVTIQECMPRPKILDVNEGVGENLFYPYNVLVNKCSGSCSMFNNSKAKICVPNVIKRINMKIYNFLMRLNETRNVLRHESCQCICRLNSSVCNSKQIWNSDTCRCDCNEGFAGIISCDKGYTWNPSTCECQCDTWCKPGQYLDHKNCICRNKLIGRVIEECTSIISETMKNNKDNITNGNTITNIFIGLFQYFYLLELFVFAYSLILSGLKVKNCLKINILIIKNYEINYKMDIEPLQTKNCDNTITPLYLVINCLFGFIEQTERSSDRYLVVSINNEIIIY